MLEPREAAGIPSSSSAEAEEPGRTELERSSSKREVSSLDLPASDHAFKRVARMVNPWASLVSENLRTEPKMEQQQQQLQQQNTWPRPTDDPEEQPKDWSGLNIECLSNIAGQLAGATPYLPDSPWQPAGFRWLMPVCNSWASSISKQCCNKHQ